MPISWYICSSLPQWGKSLSKPSTLPLQPGCSKKDLINPTRKKKFPFRRSQKCGSNKSKVTGSRELATARQERALVPSCTTVPPPARESQREKGLPRLSSDPQAEDLGARPRGCIGKMPHSSARVAHGIFIAKLSADVAKGKKEKGKKK